VRGRIIATISLIIIVVAAELAPPRALAVTVQLETAHAASVTPVEGQMAAEIAADINQERAVRGLPAVTTDPIVQRSDQAYAEGQAAGALAAGDLSPEYNYQQLGADYVFWTEGAASSGGALPTGVFITALMESAPHRAALLSTGVLVEGVGVACGPGGATWIQIQLATPDSAATYFQQNPPNQSVPPASPIVTSPMSGTSCGSGPGGCPGAMLSPLGPAAGIATMVAADGCPGYWVVDESGRVAAFGAASFHGDVGGTLLNAPIIGITATADGGGYWLLGSDGGVFSFGDARFFGSMGGHRLNAPVVGIGVDPVGRGYWEFARDGGVFTFSAPGSALPFYGSTGDLVLNQPVDGILVAPDGSGYTLVAGDGGVFNFDTSFDGSLGGQRLNAPIVGVAGDANGGYTLVASDGGIFTFDAPFYGSLGGAPPASPVVAVATVVGGGGYVMVDRLGAVYAFGPRAAYLGGTN
jgi:hypothetical protein